MRTQHIRYVKPEVPSLKLLPNSVFQTHLDIFWIGLYSSVNWLGLTSSPVTMWEMRSSITWNIFSLLMTHNGSHEFNFYPKDIHHTKPYEVLHICALPELPSSSSCVLFLFFSFHTDFSCQQPGHRGHSQACSLKDIFWVPCCADYQAARSIDFASTWTSCVYFQILQQTDFVRRGLLDLQSDAAKNRLQFWALYSEPLNARSRDLNC